MRILFLGSVLFLLVGICYCGGLKPEKELINGPTTFGDVRIQAAADGEVREAHWTPHDTMTEGRWLGAGEFYIRESVRGVGGAGPRTKIDLDTLPFVAWDRASDHFTEGGALFEAGNNNDRIWQWRIRWNDDVNLVIRQEIRNHFVYKGGNVVNFWVDFRQSVKIMNEGLTLRGFEITKVQDVDANGVANDNKGGVVNCPHSTWTTVQLPQEANTYRPHLRYEMPYIAQAICRNDTWQRFGGFIFGNRTYVRDFVANTEDSLNNVIQYEQSTKSGFIDNPGVAYSSAINRDVWVRPQSGSELHFITAFIPGQRMDPCYAMREICAHRGEPTVPEYWDTFSRSFPDRAP